MSTSNLKISMAAFSCCVSAVAIYIHLPYVIAAVSGSGAIEAVPLAIFAVSAIVALASAIYLIRLAAGEKPVKQESQAEVGSGTSSQHKSSVPTSSSQPPQTCDTVVPQNNNVPLPPPPPVIQIDSLAVYRERIKNKTGATASTSNSINFSSVGEEAKIKGANLKRVSIKKLGAVQSNKGTDKKETEEECEARVKKGLEEWKKQDDQKNSEKNTTGTKCGIASILVRRIAFESSDSESERSGSGSNSDWSEDEDKNKQKEPKQKKKKLTRKRKKPTPPTPKSNNEEGSKNPDSGIESRATSPSYSEQKTKESPSSRVDLPSIAQVNNVGPVNSEMQYLPTLSVKGKAKMFGNWL